MLRDLVSRFRQFRRQRRQRQQRANLDRTDAAVLATQAAPDPTRLLVVRNDSIGDYLLYRLWLRRLSVMRWPRPAHHAASQCAVGTAGPRLGRRPSGGSGGGRFWALHY